MNIFSLLNSIGIALATPIRTHTTTHPTPRAAPPTQHDRHLHPLNDPTNLDPWHTTTGPLAEIFPGYPCYVSIREGQNICGANEVLLRCAKGKWEVEHYCGEGNGSCVEDKEIEGVAMCY